METAKKPSTKAWSVNSRFNNIDGGNHLNKVDRSSPHCSLCNPWYNLKEPIKTENLVSLRSKVQTLGLLGVGITLVG